MKAAMVNEKLKPLVTTIKKIVEMAPRSDKRRPVSIFGKKKDKILKRIPLLL